MVISAFFNHKMVVKRRSYQYWAIYYPFFVITFSKLGPTSINRPVRDDFIWTVQFEKMFSQPSSSRRRFLNHPVRGPFKTAFSVLCVYDTSFTRMVAVFCSAEVVDLDESDIDLFC